jgi:hypothetical protein
MKLKSKDNTNAVQELKRYQEENGVEDAAGEDEVDLAAEKEKKQTLWKNVNMVSSPGC